MQTQTKKTLRIAYAVSRVTLITMLKSVKGLNYDSIKSAKVIFPNELKKIYSTFGNPFKEK